MGHHGGCGTTAAAMVHVNSQLDAKSTYVLYRELLPRGKIVRGHFFCAVADVADERHEFSIIQSYLIPTYDSLMFPAFPDFSRHKLSVATTAGGGEGVGLKQ